MQIFEAQNKAISEIQYQVSLKRRKKSWCILENKFSGLAEEPEG